ncbi:MAG: OB-fold nucleic acid binding domain-containing protein [Candidatus Pacearchaeota archaeon]
MIKAPYEQLVEKLAKLSGLPLEEIKRRVEAKKAKLSGLISSEGAAQIVAAELGVSFEEQELQIGDLLPGMRKINVTGKVLEIFPIKKFLRAGKEAEVASFEIADPTGSIRVVLWDTHHIELVKNNTIKQGSVVEIKKADVRGTTTKELHLTSNSELKISEKIIENVVKTESKKIIKKISELQKNETASIKATILQLFKPSFFNVCPECGMKTTFENDKCICVKHGAVIPKKRMIVNGIADDGSDNIRVIFFHENALKLFNSDIESLQNPEFLLEKKQKILGTEYIISGRLRKNAFFDRNEFVVNEFSEANPDDIIRELSK